MMSDQTPVGNVCCGTEGYIAPEVLRGEFPDKSADVFSVGVIMLGFFKPDAYNLFKVGYPTPLDLSAALNAVVDQDLRVIIRAVWFNFG